MNTKHTSSSVNYTLFVISILLHGTDQHKMAINIQQLLHHFISQKKPRKSNTKKQRARQSRDQL